MGRIRLGLIRRRSPEQQNRVFLGESGRCSRVTRAFTPSPWADRCVLKCRARLDPCQERNHPGSVSWPERSSTASQLREDAVTSVVPATNLPEVLAAGPGRVGLPIESATHLKLDVLYCDNPCLGWTSSFRFVSGRYSRQWSVKPMIRARIVDQCQPDLESKRTPHIGRT